MPFCVGPSKTLIRSTRSTLDTSLSLRHAQIGGLFGGRSMIGGVVVVSLPVPVPELDPVLVVVLLLAFSVQPGHCTTPAGSYQSRGAVFTVVAPPRCCMAALFAF